MAEVPGFWSTIGDRTLKYAAWGDGFDDATSMDHDGGAFTVWYSQEGVTVGVLTHDADHDYEHGRRLSNSASQRRRSRTAPSVLVGRGVRLAIRPSGPRLRGALEFDRSRG